MPELGTRLEKWEGHELAVEADPAISIDSRIRSADWFRITQDLVDGTKARKCHGQTELIFLD